MGRRRDAQRAHAAVVRQLAPLLVLLVVVASVVGVAAMRKRSDRVHRAELLFVRLDSLTQEQYALVARAVTEGRLDGDGADGVQRSRSGFDLAVGELRLLGQQDRLADIPIEAAVFRRSADAALGMVADGQPSLAGARLREETAPTADRLLAKLGAAADSSGADAGRLGHVGDVGSLVVLLVAGFIVWLLLRQSGRAQREVELGQAEMETQQRFRSLVQNSSDVITVVDATGTIQYQTPSVAQVFGYDADDLLGTDLATLVHPDDVRNVQRTLLATGLTSGSELIECRVRHSDGTYRHVETAVSARLDDPLVGGMIMNTRDITERKELEEQLAHQAFHDSLTGLANRALFRNRVEHALHRMRRMQNPIAVLLFDLDGFKNVNDSLGHAFGDAFLSAVSDRLQALLRPSDTPCRLGGDEFAVLIEDLNDGIDATLVAERILDSLRQPFMVEGKEVVTTASLGITIAESTSRDADDLLRNADVAMYTAKSRGRNRCELFKPSMHKAMLDRLDLEADLRRAMERGEFVLHYQPTVSLASGWISGMEALVRWNSPERGMVPPGMFISVAEDTGLIVPLGAWVLEEACRQAVAWKQEFGSDAPRTMSVNLSARQLQDDNLVASVSKILYESGIRPEHVVLEITESAIMHDADKMTARLHELKALGVRLAIDDFGTGYSSMSYLCSFPIDILKIDRSFVHGVGDEPQKMGIVRTIVELGRILDLQTVAEGIELDEEWQQLRELECDLGQGFWFARPLSVDQAVELLSKQAAARRRGEFSVLPGALTAS